MLWIWTPFLCMCVYFVLSFVGSRVFFSAFVGMKNVVSLPSPFGMNSYKDRHTISHRNDAWQNIYTHTHLGICMCHLGICVQIYSIQCNLYYSSKRVLLCATRRNAKNWYHARTYTRLVLAMSHFLSFNVHFMTRKHSICSLIVNDQRSRNKYHLYSYNTQNEDQISSDIVISSKHQPRTWHDIVVFPFPNIYVFVRLFNFRGSKNLLLLNSRILNSSNISKSQSKNENASKYFYSTNISFSHWKVTWRKILTIIYK